MWTWDQISGPLRAILPAIFAFAVGKGWIAAGQADWIISGVMAFGAAGWSWWTNRPSSIAAVTQSLPGVNVQTTGAASPAVVTAVADEKATGKS